MPDLAAIGPNNAASDNGGLAPAADVPGNGTVGYNEAHESEIFAYYEREQEGVIPFELFGRKNERELGEEERLFYVGITRTRRYLFLTHAKKRRLRGRVLARRRSAPLDRLVVAKKNKLTEF